MKMRVSLRRSTPPGCSRCRSRCKPNLTCSYSRCKHNSPSMVSRPPHNGVSALQAVPAPCPSRAVCRSPLRRCLPGTLTRRAHSHTTAARPPTRSSTVRPLSTGNLRPVLRMVQARMHSTQLRHRQLLCTLRLRDEVFAVLARRMPRRISCPVRTVSTWVAPRLCSGACVMRQAV